MALPSPIATLPTSLPAHAGPLQPACPRQPVLRSGSPPAQRTLPLRQNR